MPLGKWARRSGDEGWYTLLVSKMHGARRLVGRGSATALMVVSRLVVGLRVGLVGKTR